MKKIILRSLLLGVSIGTIIGIIIGLFVLRLNKNIDYNCTFTYYDDGRTGELIVDYYETSEDRTLIEVHKTNGDIWIIDSTEVRMLCKEREE